MQRFLVNLEDGQLDRLRELAELTGQSVSRHLRRAVEFYLCSGAVPCQLALSGGAYWSGSVIFVGGR